MKTVSDKTKELVRLAKENPDLPIEVATNYEVCGGDEYTYWHGSVSKVFVEYVYRSNKQEKVISYESDILEALWEEKENEDEGFFDDMSVGEDDEWLKEEFKRLEQKGEIYKAIIMYVDP